MDRDPYLEAVGPRHVSTQPLPPPLVLVINAGENLELGQLDPSKYTLPYEHVKMLGHGGCASVEQVRDVITGSVYARKVFKHVTQRNLNLAKEELRNEVRIIQRLSSHHHIIKVHATYIMDRELGIILTPVADGGDLQSLLLDCHDKILSPEIREILYQAFGCLASGLAFMHQQTIRHKDIKPSNILIHQGRVLYTDFGLSYDFSGDGRSTTTGISTGHTKRYCAPEVIDMRPRNSKSDVFSLGCVFLEIHQTLEADFPALLFNDNFHATLRSNLETDLFPEEWGTLGLCDLLRSMVQIDPDKRPNARGVTSFLSKIEGRDVPVPMFCGRCDDYPSWYGDDRPHSKSPLPPQSDSSSLWRLVNKSIEECTNVFMLRGDVTPRMIAQWVANHDLEFLLGQRHTISDWLQFYGDEVPVTEPRTWVL